MSDNTNAERQARWRAKRQARLHELEREVAHLQQGKAAPNEQVTPEAATLLAENEALKLQLKGTRTQIRNLRAQIHIMAQHQEETQAKTGGMDFRTRSAVMKVLHPDTRRQATDADRDEACQRFTQWMKAVKDAAAGRKK